MKESIISVEGLRHNYGKVTAVDDISFSVEKGQIFSFLGPNGAGKTTTINVLTTLLPMQKGKVTISGFDLETQQDSVRQSIGIVFQDFRLLENRTAFENIALALRIRGIGEKETKIRAYDALKTVNLRHKSDSYPKTLSGGEQQRVVIARAIVSEPAILLADEPTGNLDPDTAEGVARIFKDIHAKGTTILIATHNRELYKNTGKRVLRLDSGNLTGEGLG